jgi:hypothetical protein
LSIVRLFVKLARFGEGERLDALLRRASRETREVAMRVGSPASTVDRGGRGRRVESEAGVEARGRGGVVARRAGESGKWRRRERGRHAVGRRR